MRRIGLVAVLAFGVGIAVAHAATHATSQATETLTVPNASATPVRSTTFLVASHTYQLVVRGTVSDWCSPTGCPAGDPAKVPQPNVGQDALYGYAQWRFPQPQLTRQLLVDGVGLDQLAAKAGKVPYNPTHVYRVDVTRRSGRLNFVSADASSVDNNSGAWTVTLTDLGATKHPPATTTTRTGTTPSKTSGGWPYIVIQKDQFRTTLTPPLEVTDATSEVLEWPLESSGSGFPAGTPKYEARLRVTVTGPPAGIRIPTRGARTCTTYAPYDGGSSTTTKRYALTLLAGRSTLMPAVSQKVHDDVGCQWAFDFTIAQTRRPTVTISAPGMTPRGYNPIVFTLGMGAYDREACEITVRASSETHACKPLTNP